MEHSRRRVVVTAHSFDKVPATLARKKTASCATSLCPEEATALLKYEYKYKYLPPPPEEKGPDKKGEKKMVALFFSVGNAGERALGDEVGKEIGHLNQHQFILFDRLCCALSQD